MVVNTKTLSILSEKKILFVQVSHREGCEGQANSSKAIEGQSKEDESREVWKERQEGKISTEPHRRFYAA